jgi:RNA polymerase sigma-70 factor (ECF subfamily)
MVLNESADAFGDQISPFRSELLIHCYRMLGTIDEAEDAVKEAFTRAWQGRETFRRSIYFRARLYRTPPTSALNALEMRKRGQVEPLTRLPLPGRSADRHRFARGRAGGSLRHPRSVSLAF